jgi:protein TonB
LTGNAIRKVAPLYPSDAKSSRISGAVIVKVFISDKGKVIKAEAINGPQQLRAAAVEAAKQWVFRPLRIGGIPMNTMGILTFNFDLR